MIIRNKLVFVVILIVVIIGVITGCNRVSSETIATKITITPLSITETPTLVHPTKTITPTSTPTILFTGKVIFVSEHRDVNADGLDLYLMGVDGSNQKRLTSSKIGPVSGNHLSSPDGKKIAYITSIMSSSGDARLWVVNIDGTNPIQLSKPSQGNRLTDSMDWSPDSEQLVYSTGPDIYRINSDGSGLTSLAHDQSDGAETWSISFVHWLQDGRIAVITQNQGVRRIYTMNSDGSKKQEVDLSIFLREDEKRVEITKNKITVMDTIGSELFHLDVNLGFVQQRTESPDGTKIAFASDSGGDLEIYVFDITELKLSQLTDNTASDYDPAWSSDGDRIAFTSNRTSDSEIYIMNSDGSRQTRITFNLGLDSSPEWQP